MRPFFERMVRYDPPALPATGCSADALERSACISLKLPIFGLVAYTVNTKTKMMANRTLVWVLHGWSVSRVRHLNKQTHSLVAEQRRSHTADHNVDRDPQWNQEARLKVVS